ncbi:PREDICTED: probable ADP-ribosylation factor GTPase-activating protein AGD14 isoform X3 [Camelina sativa]|nr:PREDICTED: probable ADP-ribosylation factor GTPase-activating protein AGD14 isoform X3 [Camelina sativa]XP_010458117.1 PREDICTED: probable ADP-ribosylation factor GTPase-activating protein AGD14 isoform X3 [Camelina sativa]XP_010458118.1 PREDICTED: probable ADP-ribosylation factor GTPase-activating protein AGD14 isoform X3 [Camelina sativa]
MACSGIHREFTHRVKSVSMSKFTSQEVEVLQNGGNQRAREIYLKNWDHQRQRLPENSNAERVREFIKSVYVQKKYAGANVTDKPLKDIQDHGSSEDMTRRANSYHSYSQSPPYDYQYEERRYGKVPLGFAGKSASVRGLHAKASSFVYSPGRFSDHMFEDQFANEGSAPRASDFSVSSGGDPFRSDTQSPNFQKEIEFRSPQFHHSNAPPSENLFPGRQHQRTTSGLGEGVSESTGSQQPSIAPRSTTVPLVAESTKAPIDLFQLPGAPMAQSVNTVQPSIAPRFPPTNVHQPPQTYSSTPTDLFAGNLGQQSTSRLPDLSAPKNEGWASFDNPIPAEQSTNVISSSGASQLEVKDEGIPQPSTSMQWPPYPSVVDQHALSISSPWQDDLSDVSKNVAVTPPWNAFPDSIEANPLDSGRNTHQQHLEPQVVEELSNGVTQTATFPAGSSGFDFPGKIVMAQEEAWQHVNEQKSANPFDLPYDSEFDSNDMFLDVSSLQGALPDIQTPPTFLNGAQPWLVLDYVPSYLPTPAVAQVSIPCSAPSNLYRWRSMHGRGSLISTTEFCCTRHCCFYWRQSICLVTSNSASSSSSAMHRCFIFLIHLPIDAFYKFVFIPKEETSLIVQCVCFFVRNQIQLYCETNCESVEGLRVAVPFVKFHLFIKRNKIIE